VHTSVEASALFSDEDLLDTHTAVWDWCDGTTFPGDVDETGASGSVSGSHIYAAAGVYTVTLTVSDGDDPG
jgi:PKD repeat protein